MRRILFVLMFASTGCYTYSPVETGAKTVAEVVRVELTDEGTVAITPSMGTSVQVLEGPMLAKSESALQMDVRLVRRRGESLMKEWPSYHVTIPTTNIRSVEVKAIDARKTGVAVFGGAAIAAATILVLAKATSIFTGGGGKVIVGNVR